MAAETTGARPVTAAEIARVAEVEEKAKALLEPSLSPRQYVARLIEKGEFADAARFIAHALPKREGIWWAWACARKAAGAEPPPEIKGALAAAEKWIVQPNEENRRAAMAAAEAATFGTPAGCAALGAFLSGGSLGPPGTPPNPPGEYMSAKAVAGAVVLAAVQKEPEQAPEKYRAFLEQGVEVARKIKLWDQGV